MQRRVQLVVLLLALVPSDGEDTCDRGLSRNVRAIIQKYIQPRMRVLNYTLPKNCPLMVESNLYWWQEGNKREGDDYWKCGFCGKKFETESYLDRHLELRHGSEFLPNATYCLADLCPLLHCDFITDKAKRHPVSCHHSGHQMQIQCEMLMHTCFPAVESPAAGELYYFTRRSFCEAHLCDSLQRDRALTALEPRSYSFLNDIYATIIVFFTLTIWTLHRIIP